MNIKTILLSIFLVQSLVLQAQMTVASLQGPPILSPYLDDWLLGANSSLLLVMNGPATTVFYETEIYHTESGSLIASTNLSQSPPVCTELDGLTPVYPTDFMQGLTFSHNAFPARGIYGASNRLPGGNYSICVRIFACNGQMTPPANPSLLTMVLPDNPACFDFTVLSYSPPHLVHPIDSSIIDRRGQFSLTFQWTPVTPMPYEQPLYRISLYERHARQSPEQAALANPSIWEQETTITQYTMDFDYLPLETQHEYVWQVQSLDADGFPLGVNEGKSEVGTFDTEEFKELNWRAFPIIFPDDSTFVHLLEECFLPNEANENANCFQELTNSEEFFPFLEEHANKLCDNLSSDNECQVCCDKLDHFLSLGLEEHDLTSTGGGCTKFGMSIWQRPKKTEPDGPFNTTEEDYCPFSIDIGDQSIDFELTHYVNAECDLKTKTCPETCDQSKRPVHLSNYLYKNGELLAYRGHGTPNYKITPTLLGYQGSKALVVGQQEDLIVVQESYYAPFRIFDFENMESQKTCAAKINLKFKVNIPEGVQENDKFSLIIQTSRDDLVIHDRSKIKNISVWDNNMELIDRIDLPFKIDGDCPINPHTEKSLQDCWD